MAQSPPIGANETQLATPSDTTVERSTVAIDRAFFLEIFDNIFVYSSKEALFALRRSCRDLYERVNVIVDPCNIRLDLRIWCSTEYHGDGRHQLFIHDSYECGTGTPSPWPWRRPQEGMKVLSLGEMLDDQCWGPNPHSGWGNMKVTFDFPPASLNNLEVVRILSGLGQSVVHHLDCRKVKQLNEIFVAASRYIVFTKTSGLRLPRGCKRSSARETKNLVINIEVDHIDDQWLSSDLIWPNLSEIVLFFDLEQAPLYTSGTPKINQCVSFLTTRPVKNIRYVFVGLEDARQEYGSQDDDDNWKSALLTHIRFRLDSEIADIPQQTKDKWTKAVRKGMDTEKMLRRVTILSKHEYRSKVGAKLYKLASEESRETVKRG